MPDRIDEVKPPGAPTGDAPIQRVTQNCDRPVQSGSRFAWPVRIPEPSQRGTYRMRGGIRHNDGAVVLHEAVVDAPPIECGGGYEDERENSFHCARGRKESATAESPPTRAATDFGR